VLEALERGASDVILSEGRSPRVRFAGELEDARGDVTSARDIEAFLAAHLTAETRARFDATGSADLACTIDGGTGRDGSGRTSSGIRAASASRSARSAIASPRWRS
jgi:Tfp pilus assembly pilus retraction ATPase PilT